MRWFITINGSECVDPAPIDGVLYNSASYINIHRGTTITGICNQTENGTLMGVGTYEVVLNVGMCEGFNESYNVYTGFQGVSTMNIEEMPLREWRGRERERREGEGAGGERERESVWKEILFREREIILWVSTVAGVC